MSLLSDYIKKELNKGFSIRKIKTKLVEAGHDVKKIEKELKKFEDYEIKEEKKFFDFVKKVEKNKVFDAVAVIVLIITIIIAIIVLVPNKEKKLLEECEGYYDVEDKNICILKAAASLDSTKFCDQISTEVNDVLYYACVDRYWQRDDCIYEGLVGEEDECLFNKAIEGDISLCADIGGELLLECLSAKIDKPGFIEESLDYCLSFPPCSSILLDVNKDPDLCEQLSNQNLNMSYDCYENVALNLGDYSYCDFLVSGRKDVCYTNLADNLSDSSLCEFVELEEELIRCEEFSLTDLKSILSFCESYAQETLTLEEIEEYIDVAGYDLDKIFVSFCVIVEYNEFVGEFSCDDFKQEFDQGVIENYLNEFTYVFGNLKSKVTQGEDEIPWPLLECEI